MNLSVKELKCGFPFVRVSGVKDFGTKDIFECGQCFRWIPTVMDRKAVAEHDALTPADTANIAMLPTDGAKGHMTAAHGRCVKIFYEDGVLFVLNCTEEDFGNVWYDYFDLGRDYGEIKEELSLIDDNMAASVKMSPGLRILRQEPFETLISFIASANNNIPRIKKIIGNLCAMCGNRIAVPESFAKEAEENMLCFAFPSAEELSEFTEEEISERTHAGYRCGYFVKTAAAYTDNPADVDKLKKGTYDSAFEYVSDFTGVGPKVADCILLFTGVKDEAFPVDVWVRRVMNELYSPEKDSVNAIRAFGRKYFGKYAGIAQEYLFVYVRNR